MSKHTRSGMAALILIGTALAGAYVIVKRNSPALRVTAGVTASGAFH